MLFRKTLEAQGEDEIMEEVYIDSVLVDDEDGDKDAEDNSAGR